MEDIAEADGQAEQIVADARAEAARIAQDASKKLDEEVAGLRQKAEAEREAEAKQARNAAYERIRALSADAAERMPEVVQEVVNMVLPASGPSSTGKEAS